MHIIYSCTHTKIHTYMFIHSFILNIYIAPLQENYSEALPTPARSNKAVLRREKNAGEVVLLKMRNSEGRPFQVEGPTTEKTLICLVEVRAKGTRRRPCFDERSDRKLIALRGGQQSSRIGRQKQGQLSSARPRKRSYMKSAAQQGASEEHQACIERHSQI